MATKKTISIHALREEGDNFHPEREKFEIENFYPRPPRGGRLRNEVGGWRTKKISIHALREEGDVDNNAHASCLLIFLSTPSARRATYALPATYSVHSISIHALREEGDRLWRPSALTLMYFYPRPPRGGRP